MIDPKFPTARKTGLVVQEVPDEVLVYDLETNKAHCLNRTASIVWKACDGKSSVTDIAAFVGTQTGKDVSEDLVWLAIDQLNRNKLLEAEIKSSFSGQSRRDAIKKIGLASMIALPIVASLTAPQSAMASASCGCNTSTDCLILTGCPDPECCNEDFICAPDLGGGCIPG
jgi:hypothetical protein